MMTDQRIERFEALVGIKASHEQTLGLLKGPYPALIVRHALLRRSAILIDCFLRYVFDYIIDTHDHKQDEDFEVFFGRFLRSGCFTQEDEESVRWYLFVVQSLLYYRQNEQIRYELLIDELDKYTACLHNFIAKEMTVVKEHSAVTQKELFDLLERLSIPVETHKHKPVYTVEESIQEGVPGVQCKNLFLKDSKKRLWLLVALAETQISLKPLGKKIGAPELRFAQPDLLMEHLAVDPGSVTPFALMHDKEHKITILLDKALLTKKEPLGFHPLKNDATTLIMPHELQKY